MKLSIMEEVIREIIKIEYEAKGIIEEAIQKKRKAEEEHKNALEELEARIVGDATNKIKQIRDRELKEAYEKEEEKRRRCQMKMKEIEEHARLNMDLWVDEIFQRVISK
ncbi:MAG: hypothetical protein JW708_10245 [Vallitaleaceae bacterium]|nr:hypothetical protein [Vallitaleaceae bacterium]